MTADDDPTPIFEAPPMRPLRADAVDENPEDDLQLDEPATPEEAEAATVEPSPKRQVGIIIQGVCHGYRDADEFD